MIVVDTSILVAIIREEDEAALFTDILDETEAIMSIVSYVEAHMVVAGRKLDANPRRVELTAQDLGIEIRRCDAGSSRSCGSCVSSIWQRPPPSTPESRRLFYLCTRQRAAVIPLLFKGDDFAKTDIVAAHMP